MIDWLESASELYGQVIQTINNHLAGIAIILSVELPVERWSINNKIKLLKRQGCGFPLPKLSAEAS